MIVARLRLGAPDAALSAVGELRRQGRILGLDAPIWSEVDGVFALVELSAPDAVPGAEALGPSVDGEPACACGARGAYRVSAHALARCSPIRCGDCRRPVPLYRLPVDAAAWVAWQDAHRGADALYLGGLALEHAARRVVTDPNSRSNQQARALARALEQAVGCPVHLVLAEGRRRERCPACGGPWAGRCDACRLIDGV